MTTRADIQTLHLALQRIKAEGPPARTRGICGNTIITLYDMGLGPARIDSLLFYLDHLFTRWPRFSGSSNWPAPGPGPHGASDAYFDRALPKWDPKHPYGQARLELLDFLIDATAPNGPTSNDSTPDSY